MRSSSFESNLSNQKLSNFLWVFEGKCIRKLAARNHFIVKVQKTSKTLHFLSEIKFLKVDIWASGVKYDVPGPEL